MVLLQTYCAEFYLSYDFKLINPRNYFYRDDLEVFRNNVLMPEKVRVFGGAFCEDIERLKVVN